MLLRDLDNFVSQPLQVIPCTLRIICSDTDGPLSTSSMSAANIEAVDGSSRSTVRFLFPLHADKLEHPVEQEELFNFFGSEHLFALQSSIAAMRLIFRSVALISLSAPFLPKASELLQANLEHDRAERE